MPIIEDWSGAQFDAHPPENSGELHSEDIKVAHDIAAPIDTFGYFDPPTNIIDWPGQPPEHSSEEEKAEWYADREAHTPTLRISAKVRNYLLYQKVQYLAEVINRSTREPMDADFIEVILDSGQGPFKKRKENTSFVKLLEEKYLTNPSGINAHFIVYASANGFELKGRGDFK